MMRGAGLNRWRRGVERVLQRPDHNSLQLFGLLFTQTSLRLDCSGPMDLAFTSRFFGCSFVGAYVSQSAFHCMLRSCPCQRPEHAATAMAGVPSCVILQKLQLRGISLNILNPRQHQQQELVLNGNILTCPGLGCHLLVWRTMLTCLWRLISIDFPHIAA